MFVIGDMMSLHDYPGVAQVAMQQGKYAADAIVRRMKGKAPQKPFHYFDKGSMATISRFRAVANVGPLRFGGFIAWVLWLVIHVFYLIGFKNRLTTLLHWAVELPRTRPRAAGDHQPAADRPQRDPGAEPAGQRRARGRRDAATATGTCGRPPRRLTRRRCEPSPATTAAA